ncbi:hypothetical protein [Bradyrhizobium brasilense]|uniref:Uncharacterized protein n=1 Tax=Bradyrhizobium brasilense TaxID=1419277 RepID=A0ABY8JMR5_9BRAD|nr:hypothetical protein [Bradyrhizobium brasilense]WFU66677.1 hypothetical protein QA636_14690 [Bradyrhizobium brasilense]
MLVILRGKLVSWRAIPICIALGYVAAVLSFIVNDTASFWPRILNALHHDSMGFLLNFSFIATVLWPLISFSWLFGAVAGIIFLLLDKALQIVEIGSD